MSKNDYVVIHEDGNTDASQRAGSKESRQSSRSVTSGQNTTEATILKELQRMSSSIEMVTNRMDKLSETVYGPPMAKRPKPAVPGLYRTDSSADRPLPHCHGATENRRRRVTTRANQARTQYSCELSESNSSFVG